MIAGHYEAGLRGWGGKKAAKAAWNLIKNDSRVFDSLPLSNIEGKRKSQNYLVVRKVLGKDIDNIPQQIGDCVSFGSSHAVEFLQCIQMMMGQREEFKMVFPPYIYGTSRVQIGHGQIRGDGSVGAWAAQAVMDYGVLAQDAPNCPQYSGSVARQWGSQGPPQDFITIGKEHPVKATSKITTWEESVTALCNGYPLIVCSDQGFEMQPRSDGFHYPSGTWGHCLLAYDIDDEYKDPYVLIMNSWGDVMGQLYDFDTKEKLPIGCLRVRKNVFLNMIGEGDTFSFSQLDGFPAQPISKELFKLI